MKKILAIFVISIVLAGCSTGDKASTSKEDMKTVCLDGVTYYLFRESNYSEGYGFMSVKLDRESKIVPCSE